MSTYDDFLALADEFAASHAPATGLLYRSNLQVFVDWCELGDRDPLEPTPSTLNAFGRYASERWSLSTAAQATSALRGFFAYMVTTGRAETNAARHPAVKLPVSRPRAVAPSSLPLEDARALMASAPTMTNEPLALRCTIAVGALLLGGLSPGELVAARVGHLTWQEDGPAVLAVPTRQTFDAVPIHNPWLNAVVEHVRGRAAKEALILNLDGNPMNKTNLRRWLANVAAHAGVDRHLPAFPRSRQWSCPAPGQWRHRG